MNIGDQVFYVPHQCHAKEKDAQGNLQWVVGAEVTKYVNGRAQKVVQELTGKALEQYLKSKRPIQYIRPAVVWPAIVTQVNDNGTVNLNIQGANTGVTLHYDNVSIDEVSQEPHTCHPVIEPDSVQPFHAYAFHRLASNLPKAVED